MPTRPATRCSRCKKLHPGTGRCADCATATDRARGTAARRGYSGQHRTRFRAGVLTRDPVCVVCCTERATVADHWPTDRRVLERRFRAGDTTADPNDPTNGRGLCASCHGKHTARTQPGGWNDA